MEKSDQTWKWKHWMCIITRKVHKVKKSIRSGQKVKKRIFSGKNLFWKNSLFFWDFSLSLEIFLFFSKFLSLSYFSLEINWNEIHLWSENVSISKWKMIITGCKRSENQHNVSLYLTVRMNRYMYVMQNYCASLATLILTFIYTI